MCFPDPAVAGDPRAIVDQGDALADEPVEEGGLAHVRAPDDGDGGEWHD
jgi:hypothetical protein